MIILDAALYNFAPIIIAKPLANHYIHPSMSTVSVNIESGHTLYTDIVDEPFFPKNVIVKSTDKPADNPVDKQTELVTANMSLSQDIHDSGYQSASFSRSYRPAFLSDYSHSKKKSKELIGNINKQIGYLEEIMVHKDDKSLSYQFSKFPNEMKTNRQRQGP